MYSGSIGVYLVKLWKQLLYAAQSQDHAAFSVSQASVFLIAERFSYKIHFDSSGVPASSRHNNLIAETFGSKAVMTCTRGGAGDISVKTYGIGG